MILRDDVYRGLTRSLCHEFRDFVDACLKRGQDCGDPAGKVFVEAALAGKRSGADVFRIMITPFLDAQTFDVARVQKCCGGFQPPLARP